MKDENKVKQEQETEERLKVKLQKLKSRKAHNYFLEHIHYPETEKQKDKKDILVKTSSIENYLPSIKDFIKAIKKNFIPHIWEQNAITAVYLLICKAYSNLETMLFLAKQGKTFEIIDLARSGQESLDLAFLFLEPGQEENLKKWYKGKIIKNRIAREALHKAVNHDKSDNTKVPYYEIKTSTYNIYSLYTHSSYAALFDGIDVFHEDFDFNGIAGNHYTLFYFDLSIKNLAYNLLLELKNVYANYGDTETISQIDTLISKMGNITATQEEINELLKKYT